MKERYTSLSSSRLWH